jgi:lysozyme
MPNAKVIDLSHWNAIPSSLKPAAAAGVLGVIHKVTEGSGGVDDKYGARRWLANDAGLLWGGYHFLRPGDQRAHAQHFLEEAQPDARTLLAADHEDSRVSLGELGIWLEEIERLAGRRPVIYSGHVLKDQLGGDVDSVINGSRYRLWLAQYGDDYDLPPGWDEPWLWQWTQSGTIDGVTPPTDLNDYQGTDEELAAEWTGTGELEPVPTPPAVEGSLTPEAFQYALRGAGFYKGEIDGMSGPLTRTALDDWFADGTPLDLEEDGE